MREFFHFDDFINSLKSVIESVRLSDVVDIIVMALIIYQAIKIVRETRTGQLLKGIILLVAVYWISLFAEFKIMQFVLKQVLSVGLLALLIIFQPELRRILEKFGQTKVSAKTLFGISETDDKIISGWKLAIHEITEACEELSATSTGALIVIERKTRLNGQIATGTMINAAPSKELLGNIFYPKTPLHDGAVIMRDGIILAAACFLPKPQNEELINKKLGSRHRAAIGMSENSDAIVVVVSEETGHISVAQNGHLDRNIAPDQLRKALRDKLIPKTAKSSRKKN